MIGATPVTPDARVAAARLVQQIVAAAWTTARDISHALSAALVEATNVPLYSTVRAATGAAVLDSVPVRTIDIYVAMTVPSPPVATGELAVEQIVDGAREFLDGVPRRGALLDRVVELVARETGFDRVRVRDVIVAHLPTTGDLVWQRPTN